MTILQLIDEFNRLRRYVYAYTQDGVKRIRTQMSRDAPTDSSLAWIGSDVDATIDPDCHLTLESGQVMSLLDSGCRMTIDGNVFEFATAESMGLNDVTLGGGTYNPLDITNPVFDDTVQADTLSAEDTLSGENTLPADDTLPSSSCTCNCTTANANVNNRIDEFINQLKGGD